MTFQNIGNGLMTHLVTHVTEVTQNSAIAPTSILTSQLQDEFLNRVLGGRTTQERAVF